MSSLHFHCAHTSQSLTTGSCGQGTCISPAPSSCTCMPSGRVHSFPWHWSPSVCWRPEVHRQLKPSQSQIPNGGRTATENISNSTGYTAAREHSLVPKSGKCIPKGQGMATEINQQTKEISFLSFPSLILLPEWIQLQVLVCIHIAYRFPIIYTHTHTRSLTHAHTITAFCLMGHLVSCIGTSRYTQQRQLHWP